LLRRRRRRKSFLVTALLFVLVLPPGVPLWMVGLGMAFAVLVGMEVFGGTGRQIVSPPLLGLTFLMLSYPAAMTGAYLEPGSGFTSDHSSQNERVLTPVMEARRGQTVSLGKMMLGQVPGSVGETTGVVVIAGGILLLAVGAVDWRIAATSLAAFLLTELIVGPLPGGAALPMGWHVGTGGILLGAMYLATDPVTSPGTGWGRVGFGLLIGAGAMLLRRFSMTPDEMGVAILAGNVLVPFLDRLGGVGRGNTS